MSIPSTTFQPSNHQQQYLSKTWYQLLTKYQLLTLTAQQVSFKSFKIIIIKFFDYISSNFVTDNIYILQIKFLQFHQITFETYYLPYFNI